MMIKIRNWISIFTIYWIYVKGVSYIIVFNSQYFDIILAGGIGAALGALDGPFRAATFAAVGGAVGK